MQSTGHACTLQFCTCVNTPQPTPPWAVARTVERLRPWLPVPHDLEHEPQAPHAETTQSTGHGAVWHRRSALRYGQV